MEKAKSLQREEMGNQDKAEWGRSKWLKSREEADVAVRFEILQYKAIELLPQSRNMPRDQKLSAQTGK